MIDQLITTPVLSAKRVRLYLFTNFVASSTTACGIMFAFMITSQCFHCARVFHTRWRSIPPRKYCGPTCYRKANIRSPIERFLIKVDKTPSCWIWTGSTNPHGYGQIWIGRRLILAHRFAYEHYIAPIDTGLCCLHSCDNPGCVNPAHLRLGTQHENGVDAASRARMPRGTKHHASKLTPEKVRITRKEAGKTPQRILAERFNVAQQTISEITMHKTWRHII